MARVYAEPADLASELGVSDPPDNAEQLLRRASLMVDGLLVGAVYRTDDQSMPTDSDVSDALRQATVIQAAYWHRTGQPVEGAGQWGNVNIGSVSLSQGETPQTGSYAGQTIAPGMATPLQLAELWPIKPYPLG